MSVPRRLLLVVAAVGAVLVLCVSPAAAAGARISLHLLSTPAAFSQADNSGCFENPGVSPAEFGQAEPCDGYEAIMTDAGGSPAAGPFVVRDHLPAGLRVGAAALFLARNETNVQEFEGTKGEELQPCESLAAGTVVRCEFAGSLQPDQRLELDLRVHVEAGAASGAVNLVELSEAGATVASSETSDVLSEEAVFPSFAPSALFAAIDAGDGAADVQAGDHPYEFATELDMATGMGQTPSTDKRAPTIPDGGVRDVVVELPVGFVGSAQAAPKCPLSRLQSIEQCPAASLVGHISTEPAFEISVNSPVYNLVPEHGVAAELGFLDILHGTHVIDVALAPTPAGYVLRAYAHEIPDLLLWDVITSIYGDPAARNGAGFTPAAMLTNPSDCSGQPLLTRVYVDSWEHPGAFNPDGTPDVEGAGWVKATSEAPPVTGCDQLRFDPSMSAQPDTSAADSPTGLDFQLQVPQSETPGTLATPPLRDARVSMPAGMTINPSSANGLEACSQAQIGWKGPGVTDFTETAPTCPQASRIGSVEVLSPLLEKPVVGSVFLAAQDENPFGALLAAYIVIDDPATGTVAKIPGRLETDPLTGQITGVFDENPQIPFSDFKLRFFSPDLATPQTCGTFTTESDLMPWSAPQSGPDATPSSSFQITSGCTLGFAPSFHAGTTSNQAGAYSPLTLTIARQDTEQHLVGLTLTTPPGLLGSLKGIPLCSEPQANTGNCGPQSQIGEASVSSGVGPDPYWVHGGRVYLTGPYNGGPFGLSVVVPAAAGPFNFGDVVVRSSIRINPTTSQITVVSDPLPQMIDTVQGIKAGIPADLRTINVTINRPSFIFNATSCEPMAITAALTGAQGTTIPVQSRYQAAGCRSLPFNPVFTASTDGHTSRVDGASLKVKITSAGIGQANIAKVDLTIPRILPSRLTTIQKACTEAQFNHNPAGCPPESLIATATVHTPLLNSPLSGPVYFVSHGGAAFPDTEIILQGEGVVLILDGHTQIKNGVTYSRFETTPDAPFTSFEFDAPEGPYSIFAANANLCRTEVRMPTTITAQNGAVHYQDTLVQPEGCPNTLALVSRKTKGHTITLKVAVPGPGKLAATGKHLTKATKTAKARSTLTLTLKAKAKGRGKLHTHIKLTFTPATGHKLKAAIAATLKH